MEDGINRYYVRFEDRKLSPLLSYPAAVRDDFVLHRHLQTWEARQKALGKTVAAIRPKAETIAAYIPFLKNWLAPTCDWTQYVVAFSVVPNVMFLMPAS